MLDTRFLGCVLWTDFGLFGEAQRDICMLAVEKTMNDYALIRVSPRYKRLTARHTARLHLQSRRWLESELVKPFAGRTVVVTHHTPSLKSLDSRYWSDPVSAAYAEDLESFVASYPIDLWIHGHTHHCVDYQLGDTRVLSNQLGYPGQKPSDFQSDLIVAL